MTPQDKNTYAADTPEWQLFENAISSLRLEQAYLADAERFQKMAQTAREKAQRFSDALEKLGE